MHQLALAKPAQSQQAPAAPTCLEFVGAFSQPGAHAAGRKPQPAPSDGSPNAAPPTWKSSELSARVCLELVHVELLQGQGQLKGVQRIPCTTGGGCFTAPLYLGLIHSQWQSEFCRLAGISAAAASAAGPAQRSMHSRHTLLLVVVVTVRHGHCHQLDLAATPAWQDKAGHGGAEGQQAGDAGRVG